MQHRIEVPTELDGMELCKENVWGFIKVYMGKQSNKGKLMMLYDDLGQTENKTKPQEKENYVVMCEKSYNQRLYVGVKGNVFIERDAKLFTKSKAESKARGMSKNGVNKWKSISNKIILTY